MNPCSTSSLRPWIVCLAMLSSRTLADFKNAMKSCGEYTCDVSAFWQDFLWTSTPGVPARRNALNNLMQSMFEKPTTLVLHFAVAGDDFKPLQHKGALQRLPRGDGCRATPSHQPLHPATRIGGPSPGLGSLCALHNWDLQQVGDSLREVHVRPCNKGRTLA